MTYGVDVFDFDPEAGVASGRRRFLTFDESSGLPDGALPDGMCIDNDGYVWVAFYKGGCIRRYSPDGRLDGQVDLPAQNVTCCAFGGPDWGDLYITTASSDDNPDAGGLYRCRPGVTGPPVNAFAG
jgi:sugar lactone lactonase YvrE